MYLSRLILNPRSRQVQRELADPYQMHRTIMSAFPSSLSAHERVLFRVDEHTNTGQITLLVQSVQTPEWNTLTQPGQNYLLPPDATPDDLPNPAVKTYNPTVNSDQTLAFRLRANPTVKKDRPGKKQGRRVGLYREEDQLAWLKRKLEGVGCNLLSARTSEKDKITSTVYRAEQKHNLSLHSVLFDGYLKVQEPEKLLVALHNGLGSAKGLGFGLLSVAPVHG